MYKNDVKKRLQKLLVKGQKHKYVHRRNINIDIYII